MPGVLGLSPQLAQLGPPYSLVRMGHKACSESRGGKQGHRLPLLLDEVSAIARADVLTSLSQSDPTTQRGKDRRCCAVVKWCPALCDPMDGSTPGSSVLHCLVEFAQIHFH